MSQRVKNIILYSLGCLFGFIVLFFIGLYFFIKPISEYALRQSGYPDAKIESASFGPNGTIITNLQATENISIGQIELYALPSDLLLGRLGLIRISDTVLQFPLKTGGNDAGPVKLPARQIEFTNLSLQFPAGEKIFPLRFDGIITDAAEKIEAAIKFSTPHMTEGAIDADLSGDITAILPHDGSKGKISIEFSEGRLSEGDFDIRRIGGWITAEIAQPALQITSVNAQVSTGSTRIYGLPVKGLTLTLSHDQTKTEILAQGTIGEGSGQINLNLSDTPREKTDDRSVLLQSTIRLDKLDKLGIAGLTGRGDININLSGTRLNNANLAAPQNWKDLSGSIDISASALSLPGALKNSATNIKGLVKLDPEKQTIAFAFQPFTWTDANFSANAGKSGLLLKSDGSAILNIKDLGATAGNLTLNGVNGDIAFASINPPIAKKQKITVAALQAGLPVTNGTIRFSLNGFGSFTLHDSDWAMAGGSVKVEPFTWSKGTDVTQIQISATDLSLPLLFQIVPLQGLAADGTVSGTVPLRLTPDGLEIAEASLQNTASGRLSYDPAETPAFLSDSSNPQIANLKAALKNFGFDVLKIGFAGKIGGVQKVSLSLQGRNPDFYNGRAVNLNLNVEGPLQSVIQYRPGSTVFGDNVQDLIDQNRKQP